MVDALQGMCVLTERLGVEPLVLALVGAMGRAEEELERAADALEVLRKMRTEATRNLEVYRREVGLK